MKYLIRNLRLSGPNPKIYAALYDKVEIVGWKKPELEQSTAHYPLQYVHGQVYGRAYQSPFNSKQ